MMFPHIIKEKRHGKALFLISGMLLSLLLLFSIATAQNDVGTITLQRDIAPNDAVLGEDIFDVTLALTGNSTQCAADINTRPLDIVLVLDHSVSMDNPSGVGSSTRLDLLKRASVNFLSQVNLNRDRVGVVQFDVAANVVQSLSNDRASIINNIDAITSNGTTAIEAGVVIAQRELLANGRSDASHVMIVFTDGRTGDDDEALEMAQQAKNDGIRIITVGLSDDDIEDLLRGMASQADDFHLVEQAGDLERVYATIADTVTSDPVAATDIILEHRFDNTAFEIVDGSVTPANGVVSGGTVTWPLRELVDTTVEFSYQVRPLQDGVYNVDMGDSVQYNQCGITPVTLDMPSALPVSIITPTPSPSITPSITPTPSDTPTPVPTPLPPPEATPVPAFADRVEQATMSLRCDPSWLLYLLLFFLFLFFLWWLRKLWLESKKPEHERYFCRWIPWLVLPLTLLLLYLIFTRIDLCRLESVYFWRIDPTSSAGEVYVTDRYGIRPATGFDAVNQDHSCVGCHAVTSAGQKIAAISNGGTGPVVVYTLAGEEIDIPSINAAYVDWSPDGNRLAISDANEDILILDVASGRTMPLEGASESGVAEMMPAWSSDGQRIAFARGDSASNAFTLDDSSGIYVVSSSGGTAVPLSGASESGLNYYPAYSPDGRWLAFTHHEGTTSYAAPEAEIFLVPADGGDPIRLAANDDMINQVPLKNVSNSWPTWSEDGDWLAFNSKRNDPAYDLFLTHINEDGQSDPATPLRGADNLDVFEHLPYWGQPPAVNPLPELLALWPFIFLYLLIWLLYWLCKRLRPDIVPITSLPDPVVPPEPLPPVSLAPVWEAAPTLLIGVGGTGRWVLTHLKKTLQDSGFGKLPEKVHFVLLDTSENEETRVSRDHRGDVTGVEFAGVALTPDEMLLMGQNLKDVINEAKSDAALEGWFPGDEYKGLSVRAKNLANGTGGNRPMARAGLIAKLRTGAAEEFVDNEHLISNDARRLRKFLVDGSRAVLDDKQCRIVIIGSLAGGMSGTLSDLAYLARKAGDFVKPDSESSVEIDAYLTTDTTFPVKERTLAQINTVSSLREIQRFQLSGGLPYRMDYRRNSGEELSDEHSYLNERYEEKLFDDIFLFGGEGIPERGNKSHEPWATTLASMADIIAFHMDSATRSQRNTSDTQKHKIMETRQREIGQAVVSSAGSFTYRLPLVDILEIVHTTWAQKLFHVFLNGDQQDREISFNAADAGFDSKPIDFASKFIMGEFAQAPQGMRKAGYLATSRNVLARDAIKLAQANSDDYHAYLRRALDTILNQPNDKGKLTRRAPRLGYAQDFLQDVHTKLTNAIKSANDYLAEAPDDHGERSVFKRLFVWLGFGKATKSEWEQIVESLTTWQTMTKRSLDSLVGIRKLLVGETEGEGKTIIPGLYRELEMRQAEAAERPLQMDQVAVRRYLWSVAVDADMAPNAMGNQQKLADKWYETAAEKLPVDLKRLSWQVTPDGTIRLALISFEKEQRVALDDRHPESVNTLADSLIKLASHLTQDYAKNISLADVLPTQFSGEDERDILPIIERNWRTATPHLQDPVAEVDRKMSAAVGIPSEVQDKADLKALAPILGNFQKKVDSSSKSVNATVITIHDRTVLPITREYNKMPLFNLPTIEKAKQTYIRNAGQETDRGVSSPTLTTVFMAERMALAYERRLEHADILNQNYRFLDSYLVIALQEYELAELYFLAFAARWIKTDNKRTTVEMPGMDVKYLDYTDRSDLPTFIAGLLRFTANSSEDAELRQWFVDAFARETVTEQTKNAWRAFIDDFQERPFTPPPHVCTNCNKSLKPTAKFCGSCGADAPPLPMANSEVWQEPYAGEPQSIRDLAAVAALAAYKQLVSLEEWDEMVMRRPRQN